MENGKQRKAGRKQTKNSNSFIDDAYRKIKLLILNQEIIPGQKLIYDDLAKKLNMSRTPIINALNRLEQQGLVVSESYRGFTVKPMDVTEAWDSFGLREALETYTVEQAIAKADDQDIADLEQILDKYDEYQPNYYDRKKIFIDVEFHMRLAEITKNIVLVWHLKRTLQHVYLRAKLDNYSIDRVDSAQKEHRLLVGAIKDKDVLGGVEIMRNQIQNDRSHVISCLSKKSMTSDYDVQ